ncbi:MAG TPA: hypothetical protein VF641_06625 [Methylobacterium sp.]|jgi:hypothetical protein
MSARLVLLAPALIALGNASVAETVKTSPAQACAAFDLHVLTLLEDHGRAAAATGQALTTAMTDLVEARGACVRGDYDRALDRYSRIDLQGRPVPSPGFAQAQ